MLQPDRPPPLGNLDVHRASTDPTLREAHSALERGDLVEAGTRYMAAARQAPDSGDAWLGVSHVLLMSGEFERATDLVDRAIAPSHKARAWLSLSHALLTKGQLTRAAELADRAISLEPNHAEAYSLKTLIFQEAGDDQGQIASLKSAIQCSPDDPELWEALIAVLQRTSCAEAVLRYLERTSDTVPKALILDLRKVQLYTAAGRIDEARSLMRAIIEENPDDAKAHSTRALLFWNIDEYDQALDAFSKALQYSPDDPQLWEGLLVSLERVSGAQAAIDHLERSRYATPKVLTIDLLKVRLYASAGRIREADSMMSAILDVHPENPELHSAQAHLFWSTGRREAALEALKRAIRYSPDDPQLQESLIVQFARFLASIGEQEEAIQTLQDLTQRRAGSAEPFLALAEILQRNSDIPEAIATLETAMSRHPHNLSLLPSLASCHAHFARWDKTADLLRMALEKGKEASVEDYFLLGSCLRKAGQLERGKRYLEQARAAAIQEADHAAGDMPKQAAMRAVLVPILVALGRRDEALSSYRAMLQDCRSASHSYDPRTYLPDTPARLERMRRIVNGRDTLLLCHGPSVSALIDWQQGLRSLDVCIASLGAFKVLETGLLSPSGRTIDVVLETHYMGVRPYIDQIQEFLRRRADNLFITARWVMDALGKSCPQRREFEELFDEKLLYFAVAGGIQPATPYDPLRYVGGNSLSVLVNLMTIAGASRIFLFGADGGLLEGASTTTHYGSEEEDFRIVMTEEDRENAAASLRGDAADFSDAVETGLLTTEALFGVKRPPIFNVSPRSRFEPFPKITYEQAWTMLSGLA